MRKNPSLTLALVLTVAALAAVLGAGCAEKVLGPGNEVRVRIPFDLKAGPATSFLLVVSAADMDTITTLMQPAEFFVEVLLEIPVGSNRHFLAEALDDLGNVLYRGETVADLAAVRTIELHISMVPVVPMVYLSPHFPVVEMDSTFVLAVRAANLPGLDYISAILNWDRAAPVRLDSIRPAPEVLEAGAFLSQEGTWFNIFTDFGPFVDANGNGFLTYYFFSSFDGWTGDIFPVQFDLDLQEIGGVTTALDSVYVDRSQLRLVRQRQRESTLGGPRNDVGNDVVFRGGDYVIAGSATDSVGTFFYDVPVLHFMTPDLVPHDRVIWDNQTYQAATGLAENDGGLYVAGITEVGDGFTEAFVYRTDAAGGTIWQGGFNLPQYTNAAYGVAARPGGGAVAVGTVDNDGVDAVITAYDEAGFLAQVHTVNFSNQEELRAVVAPSANEFVAVGSEWWASQGVMLRKYAFTDTLKEDWTRHFGFIDNYDWGYDLTTTPDGGFLLVGKSGNQEGTPYVYVIRTDADGGEIWSRIYSEIGAESTAYGVTAAAGGGYVVVGSVFSFDGRGMQVLAMRLDEGGNIAWRRSYGGFGSDVGNSVVRRPEGGYLIVGTTNSTGAGQNDVLLLTIDEAGLKVAGP